MVCMLAHTDKQPEQRERAEANARLIAAAPEMLESLLAAEAILSVFNGTEREVPTDLYNIRAAITAALGDSWKNDQALASEGLPAAPCSLPNNPITSETEPS